MNERASFYPYFIVKDLLTLAYAFIIFGIALFYIPEIFNHSVNYIAADILVTPNHIVPEWYFLPYYAILRSILNKTIGISAMLLSIIIFYIFPILDSGVGLGKANNTRYRKMYWLFVLNLLFLGFLGSETAEYPCVEFGTMATLMYMLLIFIILPFITATCILLHRIYTE